MKTCTHCHETKVLEDFTKHPTTRDRRGSWCKPCTRDAARRIREERPEEVRAQVKAWYESNREHVRQVSRDRYVANREVLVEAERQRRALRKAAGIKVRPSARSLAARRARSQEWQRTHLDHVNAYHRAYYAAQPQKVRNWWHRRRARIVGNGGTYTQEQWADLCAAYEYRCLRCGEKKQLTVDHVVSLIKGGRNIITNLQPLCRSCNARKKTRTIDYRTSGLLLWS